MFQRLKTRFKAKLKSNPGSEDTWTCWPVENPGFLKIPGQKSSISTLLDVATLNLPTYQRDFLSLHIIIHFRFGIFKVATPGI